MNSIIPDSYVKAQKIHLAAHELVKNDPARPILHFVSPAYMLIDVWGALLHEGWYHLFYDTNYNNDPHRLGGTFGHLRSRDLVEWENLPFALMPDEANGEFGLNDGTVMIHPNGEPFMYYTRCFTDSSKNREHVAVRGSDDLVVWARMPNDVGTLTQENHGGPKFHMSWSDPVIFTEAGRTFMIVSKCYPIEGDLPRSGVIPIYEAVDSTLLKWEYRGILTEHTGEVINFIKIGEKWVLIYSAYKNPQYFVGSFNLETCRFIEESSGVLSYGYVQQGDIKSLVSRGFYATATFTDADSQPSIIGWLSGFEGDGWEGSVSFPRILELDSENRLLMKPHRALEKLRGEQRFAVGNKVRCGRTFELDLTLTGNAKLELKDNFTLTVTDTEITFNDITMPYRCSGRVRIQLLADVSVAEIFVDGGRASISRCFPMITDVGAELTLDGNASEFFVYDLQK